MVAHLGPQQPHGGLNRTSVGLKRGRRLAPKRMAFCLNRTSVGLKQGRRGVDGRDAGLASIEPAWD